MYCFFFATSTFFFAKSTFSFFFNTCMRIILYHSGLPDSVQISHSGLERRAQWVHIGYVYFSDVFAHNFLSFENERTKSPKKQYRTYALDLMSKVSKLLDAS